RAGRRARGVERRQIEAPGHSGRGLTHEVVSSTDCFALPSGSTESSLGRLPLPIRRWSLASSSVEVEYAGGARERSSLDCSKVWHSATMRRRYLGKERRGDRSRERGMRK